MRAVTGKPKIAKFEGAYHGSFDALEISTHPPIEEAGPDDAPEQVASHEGMSQGAQDEVVILPYNQRETVELILREHQDEIAGVFYDGKPAMLDIPPDFTHFLRDITKELGIVMVMDETVSFRAGPAGYQGSVGVEPDLTTFGKTFGGGLPVGAIGGRADLMDVLDNTGEPTGLTQSGTFSGNNFTLAAGLATLKALTPDVYVHLDGLRIRLHAGLDQTFDRAGVPCQVLSAGSMVNPFLTDQPVRDYRSSLSEDGEMFSRLSLGLLLKGYVIGSSGMCMILSSPMGEDHIDGLVNAVGEVLEDEDGSS